MRQILKGLGQDELKSLSAQLETRLLRYLQDRNFPSPRIVIGLYLPLAGEPQLRWDCWQSTSWQLSYPAPHQEGMRYLAVTSLPQTSGPWASEGPSVEPNVIVVPGLAFSETGIRLGRGGGYFDRYLERRHPELLVVGVCFESQLRSDLVARPHDQLMDVIITESRAVECSTSRAEKKGRQL